MDGLRREPGARSREAAGARERCRILFLCSGNSCRSQMAEAWTKYLKGTTIEAHSAGIDPRGIDPRAVQVMREVGIDIATQRSKPITEFSAVDLDWVVTLCGDAREQCPVFLGATRVAHVGFDDPPRLAAQAATEEEALAHYRRVRDEIRDFVARLPELLETLG